MCIPPPIAGLGHDITFLPRLIGAMIDRVSLTALPTFDHLVPPIEAVRNGKGAMSVTRAFSQSV